LVNEGALGTSSKSVTQGSGTTGKFGRRKKKWQRIDKTFISTTMRLLPERLDCATFFEPQSSMFQSRTLSHCRSLWVGF
jgi:hypothetical protein